MNRGKPTAQGNGRDIMITRKPWEQEDYHLSFPVTELQDVLEKILEQMRQLIGCDSCLIWLLKDDEFRLAASCGLPKACNNGSYRLPLNSHPLLLGMITNQKPVIWSKEMISHSRMVSQRIITNDDVRHLTDKLKNMNSYITAPLVYLGRPLGMLVVFKKERNYYIETDGQSVMAFANQVAMTLENARLYRLARRRAAQLELAGQVKQKITVILEPDRLLSEVVRLIKDKFGYYHVNLFLAEENTDEVFLRECIGEHAEKLKAEGLRLKIGEQGIVGNVARTGNPFLCNDVSREPIYIRHELMPKTQSELAVPLQFGDVVVGVLDVQSKEPDTFHEDDITTLQILGGQIAVALENARLFKETRHQLKMMRVLYDISVDIPSQLKLQKVLNAIVRQAARLLSAKGSTLAVCEPETQLARIVALHNVPFEYEELVFRPGTSVAGHVLATGKPIIINDNSYWAINNSDSDSQFIDFTYPPYEAILSVPLVWEGQAIGALTVVNCGERRPFTRDDARFLSLLASLAGAALNNAEMYYRLEHKVEERTRELADARGELAQKADQLQQLLAATVYLQEEERTRIARDLHDGYNQLITGTLFEIQAAKECVQRGRSEAAIRAMKSVKELLLQIETENRRIISGLRPPVLESHGLEAALYWLSDACQKYCETVSMVHVTGQPFRLAPHTETTVFRIVQESLNNVAAYARAGTVNILLEFHPDRLYVKVIDDGQGFDTDGLPAEGRMGLIGMRERARSIGGQLDISSVIGKGTTVMLDLPLPTPEPPPADGWGETDCGQECVPDEQNADICKIVQAIEDLDNDRTIFMIRKAMDSGMDPLKILHNGVLPGLKAIETKFKEKYYFLGELMIGAKLAEVCINIIKADNDKQPGPSRGVVVIGAIQGDIHSIGYGLVAMQLELAGYKVHDLGINVPIRLFVEKALEYRADIIGLSAFLLTTVSLFNDVFNYLRDTGLRNRFKVIIGGMETSQVLAESLGADGWASDAGEAVKLCDRLLGNETED